MKPSQMIKKVAEPFRPAWEPVPRTAAIIIPSGTVSARDLLFMEDSASLERGICPRCQAPCRHEVAPDQWVWFRCTKQPVFHEFKRTLAFLARD